MVVCCSPETRIFYVALAINLESIFLRSINTLVTMWIQISAYNEIKPFEPFNETEKDTCRSRFIAINYGIITDILMNNLVENNANNRATLKIIDMLGNEMA